MYYGNYIYLNKFSIINSIGAEQGGFIYLEMIYNVNITNCVFLNNIETNLDEYENLYGGAIYAINSLFLKITDT